MADQLSSFSEKLRRLREQAGLSQYALARRTGLTKQALSRLEAGERDPGWTTVQKIAAALGVSCETFVDPDVVALVQADLQSRPRGRPRKQPPASAADNPKRKRLKKSKE